MRDRGYVEGQTIALDFRLSKGVTDALPALAAELVRIPVDVIVTDSTSATLAAFNAERRELHRNVAQHVVGNEFIPASVRHDIIERTDGIPLFVEEMTKAVLEA